MNELFVAPRPDCISLP